MRNLMRMIPALLAVLLMAAACGEGQRVGSEWFEEVEGGEAGPRLGERLPEPEEEDLGEQAALGRERPTPTPEEQPAVTPPPVQEAQYFEIELIANSPFYRTQHGTGQRFIIPAGTSIRVTNRDQTPERSGGRSFTDEGGAFHSGLLTPGASWTWHFASPGRFQIVDEGITFASAVLEVQ